MGDTCIKFVVCVYVSVCVSVCLGRIFNESVKTDLAKKIALAFRWPSPAEQNVWFYWVDSACFWQPLFHIRSLDVSTIVITIPWVGYCSGNTTI